MKKIFTVIISLLFISTLLIGCGDNKNNEPEPQDKNFMTDIKKGLNNRWKHIDAEESKRNNQENLLNFDKKYYSDLVDIELNTIQTYKNAEFSDVRLSKVAKDYIEALELQKESLEYISSNIAKYDELWQEGATDRYNSLKILIDEYGLEIDSKHVDEMKDYAKGLNEKRDEESQVEELIKGFDFQEEKRDGDYATYSCVVQNTTNLKFDHFNIQAKLLDADDVSIDTGYANTGAWSPAEKIKFSFSTDAKFEKVKVSMDEVDYYVSK